jgi:hypothetical protein
MHVTAGAQKVDRMLYVEGSHDNKMLVRPTGLIRRIVPCVELDPNGEEVRKNSSRTITDFGMKNILETTRERLRESQAKGGLEAEFLGLGNLDGCRVLMLRASDSEGNVVIELDASRLVPLRIRKHDAAGQLVGLFYFKDLEFNCGLDDSDFTKEANGLES